MAFFYEFEKPVEEAAKRLRQARQIGTVDQITQCEAELMQARQDIYANLQPWHRVQLARHPQRPSTLQMLPHILEDFMELHGDRQFRDDPSIVAGVGRLCDRSVVFVAQVKGKDTNENIKRNFGMAHPEGYRKALRVMKLAERWEKPVITLVDTPGAYPGLAAEERGQAESIARNLLEMAGLKIPLVTVVVSEGGSGGALGIAVSDRVLMLENAVYSVISPEGCAAILWKDAGRAQEAAEALKMTASELLGMGVVDGIVPEPAGGAHHDPAAAAKEIRGSLADAVAQVAEINPAARIEARYQRFRRLGSPSPLET